MVLTLTRCSSVEDSSSRPHATSILLSIPRTSVVESSCGQEDSLRVPKVYLLRMVPCTLERPGGLQ